MAEKINVNEIVEQTGVNEQDVRKVLVKLNQMGWVNSHHIPSA